MSDRLAEIEQRYADVQWLIEEIKRLRARIECDSPDGRWHRRADGVWAPRYKGPAEIEE